MATEILTRFKQKIASLELIPSGGGCFEVQLDGELVYSKLETGEFPEESDILTTVEGRL